MVCDLRIIAAVKIIVDEGLEAKIFTHGINIEKNTISRAGEAIAIGAEVLIPDVFMRCSKSVKILAGKCSARRNADFVTVVNVLAAIAIRLRVPRSTSAIVSAA